MNILPLAIPSVLLIEPKRFGDARGFFSETFREDALSKAGFDARFVQDNHSLSAQVGTLRGLHYQKPPHAQDKLVRVVRGAILDVAVDIRAGSPNFGMAVIEEISAANGRHILVPKGFAHGFLTLEPDTEVIYKVTDYYSPECDTGLAWDDPDLGIDWKLSVEPLLSDKDRTQPSFASLPANLFPFGEY
jgi:dTDP-4-dehydrorhamnose 3,5-epimerase